MCLSKGVFVLVCLLLGALGALFVALSAQSINRGFLLVFGSLAISGSISGIMFLQHDISCDAGIVLY